MARARPGPNTCKKPGPPIIFNLPPKVDLTEGNHLLVVEGEKKTLALWQAGFQIVGIGGVWNWRTKGGGEQTGESRPIPDLDRINWERSVTIVFDSDGHYNSNVRLAAFRLARELSRRGAKVSIIFIPGEEV